MRSFVLIAVGALALALAGASRPAATVTKTVRITATAFKPASVTIATGSAIKWSNTDTKTHQVVANSGAFASPMITAGHTWTHTFNTAGTYRYHDALHPALTGRVVVTGPAPAVTIGAATPIIVYGQATHVAGQVSNGQAGQTVTVYAQPYGTPSQTLIATLLTGPNGVWDTVVTPDLVTTYQAHWRSLISANIAVSVRPNVILSVNRRGYGLVRVKAARSMAGRKVYIQRFTRFHQWVTLKRVILSGNSSKRFRLHVKRGRYVLRAYMTINQAGPGYLDGMSRTIVYRKRR
jgi:plastocyanin